MDLGFGGLIEKFEEYVGKRPTALMMIVLFLLILGWGIEMLVRLALVVNEKLSSQDPTDNLIGFGIGLAICFAFGIGVVWYMEWRFGHLRDRIDRNLEESRRTMAGAKKDLQERYTRNQALLATAAETSALTNKRIIEAEKRFPHLSKGGWKLTPSDPEEPDIFVQELGSVLSEAVFLPPGPSKTRMSDLGPVLAEVQFSRV